MGKIHVGSQKAHKTNLFTFSRVEEEEEETKREKFQVVSYKEKLDESDLVG